MRFLMTLAMLLVMFFSFLGRVEAVEPVLQATSSAMALSQATQSGVQATDSGIIVKIIEVEKQRDNLTEPVKSKSRLEQTLDSQIVTSIWPFNFLKVGIRQAVSRGVQANTIVLLLLFPLVAGLVAFSRNVIGIKGFGIFSPAVVSVAFLSTGITAGLILFFAIIAAALVGRVAIRSLGKIPYMPRMAIIIWMVSFAVLGLLLMSPLLNLAPLTSLGIFPVLLFVLLAETFIEVQIKHTISVAVTMTVETLILALLSFFVMSSFWIQELVLLNPEISALMILFVDVLIGRYTGLRLLEMWRFRELLKN